MDSFLRDRGRVELCSSDKKEKKSAYPPVKGSPTAEPREYVEVAIDQVELSEEEKPKVQLIVEDERVELIALTCSCGRRHELECRY